jgi:hypothetical protein
MPMKPWSQDLAHCHTRHGCGTGAKVYELETMEIVECYKQDRNISSV